jgi:hypothetical protein
MVYFQSTVFSEHLASVELQLLRCFFQSDNQVLGDWKQFLYVVCMRVASLCNACPIRFVKVVEIEILMLCEQM